MRGRNSDNTLIKEITGWEPSISLQEGLEKTYVWIKTEIEKNNMRNYVQRLVRAKEVNKATPMVPNALSTSAG